MSNPKTNKPRRPIASGGWRGAYKKASQPKQTTDRTPLVRLGGGWEGNTSNGGVKIEFQIRQEELDKLQVAIAVAIKENRGLRLIAFVNDYKQEPRHPDWTLNVNEVEGMLNSSKGE